MAGSWNHIVTDDGKFWGTTLIDNLGDAYEALEECYGMVHYLAASLATDAEAPLDVIERARQRYQEGIALSPGIADEDEGEDEDA